MLNWDGEHGYIFAKHQCVTMLTLTCSSKLCGALVMSHRDANSAVDLNSLICDLQISVNDMYGWHLERTHCPVLCQTDLVKPQNEKKLLFSFWKGTLTDTKWDWFVCLLVKDDKKTSGSTSQVCTFNPSEYSVWVLTHWEQCLVWLSDENENVWFALNHFDRIL